MKKDKDNAMIAGVCAGLAKEYNVDVTIVRLGFAAATLMGFGLPVVIYIVMALVMPSE
jgi:phage shock protein C